MRIVQNTANDHWICVRDYTALVSYNEVIAFEDIHNGVVYITEDKLSMTSKKSLNRFLRASSKNARHEKLSNSALRTMAYKLLNAHDDDPITTDDNMTYVFWSIESDSNARDYIERFYGISALHGRVKSNTVYGIYENFFLMRNNGLWLALADKNNPMTRV